MSNKTKNILSNVFGVILLLLAVFEFFSSKETYVMIGLVTFGLAAVFYKVEESKYFLTRFFDGLLGAPEKVPKKSGSGGDLPNPDDSIKPSASVGGDLPNPDDSIKP